MATGMIVLAAVLGVAVWLGLVMLASRRPYFKHPHPDPMPGKVRGGVHLGDPRSLGPPEGEQANLQEPPADAGAPARHDQERHEGQHDQERHEERHGQEQQPAGAQ